MIRNYFKTAWRTLFKHKWINSVHILGLAVGIASALLLFLTAMFELNYDQFHKNKDQIALVYKESRTETGSEYNTAFPISFSALFQSEVSGIEKVSRYYNNGVVVRNGDKEIQSNNKYVDSDFLEIFSFPLVQGNEKALNDLQQIVIDEAMAMSLFGRNDVVGMPLEVSIGGIWTQKTIGAVLKVVPKQSSLNFTSLLRYEQRPNYKILENEWDNQDTWVFAQLSGKIIDTKGFNEAAKAFTNLHFERSIEKLKNKGIQADSDGNYMQLQILPMNKFHLNSKGLVHGGSEKLPWILLSVAGLILFIASSNFINLSLATAMNRNKELGTRKTLGGNSWQLMGQFWFEAMLLCTLALVIGIILTTFILPEYNATLNYSLKIQDLLTPINLAFFFLGFLVLTTLSSGYPAWRITKSHVLENLKGTATIKATNLRNALTIMQFVIAIVLMVSTIMISRQMHYLATQPLGFNQSEVLSIPLGSGVDGEYVLQKMRSSLQNQPWFKHLTGSDVNIGRGKDGSMSTSKIGFDQDGKTMVTHFMRIDFDFLRTLDINLIAGRDLDAKRPADTNAVLINVKMAEQLGGIDYILNKTIGMDGDPVVVGVMDDFHFKDLKRAVEPLTVSPSPHTFGIEYIFVRVQTDNLAETLTQVDKIWKEINPKASIAPSYLDENTQNQYLNEQRFSKIVMSGAAVTIFVSCLGLLALSLLAIQKRMKEIGIRKILGSSTIQIVFMLSKEFMKLVVIAFLIAAPIAWWLMSKWLQNYAFHVDLTWWIFAIAGLLTCVIALSTIVGQAIRASLMNPVRTLRTE